jgi:hypothetical protein
MVMAEIFVCTAQFCKADHAAIDPNAIREFRHS